MKSILKKILFSLGFNEQKYLQLAFHAMDPAHKLQLADVGAAGSIEPRWKKIESNLNYIGFEPDERAYAMLESTPSNMNSRTFYPYAVWDQDGEVKFHLCRRGQVSSVLEPNRVILDRFPNAERFDVVETVPVQTKTIDGLLEGQCDFIKLDVQGGELKVLGGAEETIKQCIGLQVEVSFIELYKEQPLFGDVDSYFVSRGFEFIDYSTLYRWGRDKLSELGQLVSGDALYFRSPEWIATSASKHQMLSYLKCCLLYHRYDLFDDVMQRATVGGLVADEDKLHDAVAVLKKNFGKSAGRARALTWFLRVFSSDDLRAHLIY